VEVANLARRVLVITSSHVTVSAEDETDHSAAVDLLMCFFPACAPRRSGRGAPLTVVEANSPSPPS